MSYRTQQFSAFALGKKSLKQHPDEEKCEKVDTKLPPKLGENPVVQHVAVRMLFSLLPYYRAVSPLIPTRQT